MFHSSYFVKRVNDSYTLNTYLRSEAENLCKELGEHHRAPFQLFTVKPWEKGLGKVSVFPALSGVSGRDDNVDTIR